MSWDNKIPETTQTPKPPKRSVGLQVTPRFTSIYRVSSLRKPDDKIFRRRYEHIEIFKQVFTLHGFRDIILCSRKVRCFWIFALTVTCYLALHHSGKILERFNGINIMTNLFTKQSQGLRLPDLIICPFNRFNKSVFETYEIHSKLAQYIELSYASPQVLRIQKQKILGIGRDYDALDDELQLVLQKNNLTLTKLMELASFCWLINETSGFGQGMRITIVLPLHDYHYAVNQIPCDGFMIKLANENGGIDHAVQNVHPGVYLSLPVSLHKKEYTNVPKKYDCRDGLSDNYNVVYCMESCLTSEAESHCKCSPAGATMKMFPEKVCTAKELWTCFAEVYFKNLTAREDTCDKQCFQNCNQWKYIVTPSTSPLSEVAVRAIGGTEEDIEKLRRSVVIDFYYTQLEYDVTQHTEEITMSSLLAQVGGQISLFTGLSLVSFLQFFIYSFLILYDLIYNRIVRNIKKSAPSSSRRLAL
ncbi:unnamed protein product [Caenorhabditis auriculariae]|uniref:Uncharacterized protein n=1 Tax=Caenorhabditis auriculariae TaxID=2777116 RepID=A0A8S1H548_9PELO|nr:unnamed protein product [Caenorhabditis auriculariae]